MALAIARKLLRDLHNCHSGIAATPAVAKKNT
jgi:hypothetical protein